MKIYIAAKYQRRHALRPLADRLTLLGHEITAQWLWDAEDDKDIIGKATMDVEDVVRADALVFIGEPQASENRGGGRWFEFGLAFGLGKKCVALLDMDPAKGGHDHLPLGHESVFTGLPEVWTVTDEEALVKLLAEIEYEPAC